MGEAFQDRLVVTSDTKYLMVVREFMARVIGLSNLPTEDENKVTLAVDEAVSNIIEHGYDCSNDGRIEIEVEGDDSRFKIVIYSA